MSTLNSDVWNGAVQYQYDPNANKGADDDNNAPYSYDPDFRGEIKEEERHCTDVIMLVIFLIFIAGMLGLFFYALPKSHISYLYIPTDHRGLLCGYNNKKLAENGEIFVNHSNANLPDLTNKPVLCWVRPGKHGWARSFCVEKCPEDGLFIDAFANIVADMNSHPNADILDGFGNTASCGTSSKKVSIFNYSEPASNSKGWFCEYATFKFLSRCFPSAEALNGTTDESKANFSSDATVLASAISDLYTTRYYIIGSVIVALILSMLWLMSLRATAGLFIWLTVALTIGIAGFLTYLCYMQKENKFNNATVAEAYSFGVYSADLNKQLFTVLYWILVVFDVILVLLVLFLCERINLSIDIIKIVSVVFSEVKNLFLFTTFKTSS